MFKSCLLIEGDPEDQDQFMEALHRVSPMSGCYAVSNCPDALDILLDNRITIDYIFVDIHATGMESLDFLKRIKQSSAYRQIPVIVLAGTFSKDMIDLLKGHGAAAVYAKARISVLCEILRKYFGKEAGETIAR